MRYVKIKEISILTAYENQSNMALVETKNGDSIYLGDKKKKL